MLYEMMKDLDISGSYLLQLLKKHLPLETSESVISENLQYNIPSIINFYIPLHLVEHEYGELFEMILQKMLAPKKFTEDVTNHMLVESILLSARTEKHLELLRQWYESGKITDLDGKVIEGIELSTKHKHSMVRRLFTSRDIPLEDKQKYLKQLEEIDTTDWTDKTKHYCKSAIPDIEVKR